MIELYYYYTSKQNNAFIEVRTFFYSLRTLLNSRFIIFTQNHILIGFCVILSRFIHRFGFSFPKVL
jgi:hypothetical protein